VQAVTVKDAGGNHEFACTKLQIPMMGPRYNSVETIWLTYKENKDDLIHAEVLLLNHIGNPSNLLQS